MAIAHDLQTLLARFGSAANLRGGDEGAASQKTQALSLSWPELDAVLPDGGLPRGVVELTAPRALGGSTSVALATVRAGQVLGEGTWCAWIDPEGTLHAPGVVRAGVDLEHLLVVRSPRAQLARVGLKVVLSHAFEVVVIDFAPVPLGSVGESKSEPGMAPEVWVRKLALAAEASGTTVLLLTDVSKPRAVPWPVALRVELSRPGPQDLVVRVAKDKRGRIGLAKTIPFRPVLRAAV
jgi:hypothetical protein